MKQTVIIAAMILTMAFASTARAEQSSGEPDAGAKPSLSGAVSAVNGFSFDLYKAAAAQAEGENIFLSPYSVSTALAMTYAGAHGTTAREMESALRFTPDIHEGMGALIASINETPEETAVVKTANALWLAKGEKILPQFRRTLSRGYNAGIAELDFASRPENSRATINKWVEERTAGKIKDIVPGGALGRDTKLVLTNAVYFKAGWMKEFDAEKTKPRPFRAADGKTADVPTMNRTAKELSYAKLDGAQMIDLPYKDGRFSMFVILPDEESALETLEKGLNEENFAQWRAQMHPANVEIFMPKFTQESSFDLSMPLAQLGMPSAFDANAADFSGISGTRDAFISAVLHKTFVEVAEEGTEAAAATAVIAMRMSMAPPLQNIVFRADRPFVYIITDNESGAILFIGRYVKP